MNVLITGVSGGLGRELARGFLERGDSVWGVGRRESDPSLARLIDKGLSYKRCDIASREDVLRLYKTMENHFTPDIIILGAGNAIDDIIGNTFSCDRAEENFDINLFGALIWVELFLPLFLKRKSGIFAAVSSMSIYRENHLHRIGYSASKAALSKSFLNLRQEYLDSGVTFTTFVMGRLGQERGMIGTSYKIAAERIIKTACYGRIPAAINIPFSQYLATKALSLIPDSIFTKYIMR